MRSDGLWLPSCGVVVVTNSNVVTTNWLAYSDLGNDAENKTQIYYTFYNYFPTKYINARN